MNHRRIARVSAFVTSFLLAIGMQLATLSPARADGPAILGAGSTWSQIAIDQWRADVYRYGLQVNYQGVGSTTGRQFFAAGTVDFGASEIPFQIPPDPPVQRSFSYLPDVAGGTSMMYNLQDPSGQQIRDLRLTPATIAGIFTGQITSWSDHRIQAEYGKPLPNIPIKVLVRSDGSGTSAQFSAYIAATDGAAWRSFLTACHQSYQSYTSFWPYGQPGCLQAAIGQRGSDGIANYVANPGLGNGAIGYLEAAYAVSRNFPVVAVKNVSGGERLIDEAESEHKEIDGLVAKAQGMSMHTDEVVQKVKELRDAVVHHATEEEGQMFPVAEKGLGQQLMELGEQMAVRKKKLATSRVQQAKRLLKKAARKIA